ncbi:MAG TPA: DUF3891 family protein [Solirubrobacteraceae bacterium]|nr:DUF3891 family protein [Solirubrobacteraceae bacterium]
MLVRELSGGRALCIGQASHAWLSSQLARAWAPTAAEEVCLAAEQHDVGMAQWDLTPALDETSGRPVGFMQMALSDHLALWSAAPARLFTQSRHAALLVSLHGTRLYELRDLDAMQARDADAVRAYLAAQRALQERLGREVGVAQDELRRDQARLFCWDGLSLALCLGWAPYTTPEVDGRTLHLQAAGQEAHTLSPWPFAPPELTVRCEGRLLRERSTSEAALHGALERAERVDLRFLLRPG